jgi:hypothetical protein
MITNIWLKSQPNKKISYPDCLPKFYFASLSIHIFDISSKNNENKPTAIFDWNAISRVEFRP